MEQVNCLNLCEILPYLMKKRKNLLEILEDSKKLAGYTSCERLYLGSSFCGKYFLHQSIEEIKELVNIAEGEGQKIVLEVPVFSEGDLGLGKHKIEQILMIGGDIIDEITVNDYGMLPYVRKSFQQSVNLGRMFMKDYRDPRYEEYFQIPWKPKVYTRFFKALLKEYQVKGLEFDITHQNVDFSENPEGVTIGIHVPYCYQTVGRICEFASIHKDIMNKYRPNTACGTDCMDNLVKYTIDDGNREYVRFGRTVYFKHPGFEIKGLNQFRLIYFPIDL
ncbi:MAG: hypothetical protein IKL07_06995 [Clostridium sp.]|nr:hypothetical protein [Clostridium sp.]